MKIITINNVDNIYFKDNINNVARQSTSCRAQGILYWGQQYINLFIKQKYARNELQKYTKIKKHFFLVD